MNRSYEVMFEQGVNEMSWDDTVTLATSECSIMQLYCIKVIYNVHLHRRTIAWEVPMNGLVSKALHHIDSKYERPF